MQFDLRKYIALAYMLPSIKYKSSTGETVRAKIIYGNKINNEYINSDVLASVYITVLSIDEETFIQLPPEKIIGYITKANKSSLLKGLILAGEYMFFDQKCQIWINSDEIGNVIIDLPTPLNDEELNTVKTLFAEKSQVNESVPVKKSLDLLDPDDKKKYS